MTASSNSDLSLQPGTPFCQTDMRLSKVSQRSAIMRAVRSKNTGPELLLRQLLWNMGYRYRLHRSTLPGKPDICMVSRRKVIFVHGCFWHQHARCRKAGLPRSNRSYWAPKLRENVERDREAMRQLRKMGWDVLVVWQCALKNIGLIESRLQSFLGPPTSRPKRGAPNSTPT
jgi:DNA mismatch endonuclease (patch repair protein)